MSRLLLSVFCGVMAVGIGTAAYGVDSSTTDQPAVGERGTMAQPADRGTIIQTEPGPRVIVRSDAMAARHVGKVRELPVGAVAAVDTAFPSGTIVDVDKKSLQDKWDVTVVDRRGDVYKVTVNKEGTISDRKILRKNNERIAKLPENLRAVVMDRYPNAVIYDSDTTVEDGKKAYEVEFLNNGQRMDVKLHHRTGEILEIEADKDDVGHDPGM